MELKFQRLSNGEGLPLPYRASEEAAGLDVQSADELVIMPGQTVICKTGFAVEVPPGFELQVRSRSGLAAKHAVFVTNGVGTIDADYRGEVMAILTNLGPSPFRINRGDRIAQLVPAKAWLDDFTVGEVSLLSDTARGSGGMGSTGV